MKIKYRQGAGPSAVFAPGCFDSQIGSTTPFGVGDDMVDAVITGVVVSDDGTYAEITLDVPSGSIPEPRVTGSFSVAGDDA